MSFPKELNKPAVDVLRARFLRWLGQLCKGANYTKLLESEFRAWLYMARLELQLPERRIESSTAATEIKAIWKTTIQRATLERLQKLDALYSADKTATAARKRAKTQSL